ncbi:MAG: hypothetical protein JWM34_1575 [Ilumatobacteraceae bacterium]|nr:hypothetical protein [Ilumatobacteraceae bacterium]
MCDACTPTFNRRSLLRSAAIGGAAVATGSLWLSRTARAAPATSRPDSDPSPDAHYLPMETKAMAEDAVAVSGHDAVSLTSHAVLSTASVVATRVIPAPNTGGTKAPAIVSRAQWKANERIRLDARAYAPIRKLIVHHTATANKPSNPAAVVREVEAYHASGRGFSDTGYNFMIDHKGVVYEGRAARRYASTEVITGEDTKGWGVVGAHAKGFNAGSCGVCLIGDFETASPTDAALNSLVTVLAWQASRHRIDAHGAEDYFDIYGGHHVFANITGHRQVGQTECPGALMYALLPTVRDEVEKLAGSWKPLVVDTPGVLRYEWGSLRGPLAASANAVSTTSTTTPSDGTDATSTSTTSTSPPAVTTTDSVARGTGTSLTAIRVVSTNGTVYTAGKARKLGNPSARGITSVVSLTNAATGDGYWALGANGSVAAFGGLSHFGDATGKGMAVDITATGSGGGYYVLMADGGIYPFGDAAYASSPKKASIAGNARRIAARPQGDGYWVLMDDGSLRAFGSAPKLAVPSGAGTPIDVTPTPSGAGLWLLTDAGRVAVVGDAVDAGDLKRSKVSWKKPVAHLVATPSGKGYVIVNVEGSMLSFGDAPSYAAFGGSGMTVAGVALAFS